MMIEFGVAAAAFLLGGALLKWRCAGRTGAIGVLFYGQVPYGLAMQPIWLPLFSWTYVVWIPDGITAEGGAGWRPLSLRALAEYVRDGRTGPEALYELLDAVSKLRRREALDDADRLTLSRWFERAIVREE